MIHHKAHKASSHAHSPSHSATRRARRMGRELAGQAKRRRGGRIITVEGFVASVEEYIEARRDLGDEG